MPIPAVLFAPDAHNGHHAVSSKIALCGKLWGLIQVFQERRRPQQFVIEVVVALQNYNASFTIPWHHLESPLGNHESVMVNDRINAGHGETDSPVETEKEGGIFRYRNMAPPSRDLGRRQRAEHSEERAMLATQSSRR